MQTIYHVLAVAYDTFDLHTEFIYLLSSESSFNTHFLAMP